MVVLCAGVGWAWVQGLASLGPFLGAPAGSPGQVKYTGGSGSGAWHPLTPSWVPSVVCRTTDHGRCGGGSACACCCGSDPGIPVPQDDPVVQVVVWVLLGLSVTFGEEGGRSSSHR